MSSALKPVLTPGSQNPPVPSQLNKPMHPQNIPTTYGQPMSHIPQNLVNIPHNAPSSTNIHNPAHSNAHVSHHINTNAHSTNHYSLNVPNASQHYPVSANAPVSSHSAPVSSHHVSNTNPSTTTHTSPAKNIGYNSNYQTNLGSLYKASSVPNVPSAPVPPSQAIAEESQTEKPQSNGTPEVKLSKSDPPQNHVSSLSGVKDKPPLLPDKIKVTPEKPILSSTSSTVEQKQNTTPEQSNVGGDKNLTNSNPSSSVIVSSVTSVSVTTVVPFTGGSDTSATASSGQSSQQPVNTDATTDNKETQDSTEDVSKLKEQNQKVALKLATPRNTIRKVKAPKAEIFSTTSESLKPSKSDTKSPSQKSPGSGGKSKRARTKTQPYQSPLPEVEMISKITATIPKSRNTEDKLIIFYKNEFLAVRNSEGGFYVCQAVQNIYKSSPRIKIRWLSQDKGDKEIYTPDFYDYTDFDCILTNLNLERVGKGKFRLPANERIRTDSILRRALAVERGDVTSPPLTEEHPDGLDLSLYKEESQLKKRKAAKRKASTLLKTGTKTTNIRKSPDQPKVRKMIPNRPKQQPMKKFTAIKKALSSKVKKPITVISSKDRAERAAKRRIQEVPSTSKNSTPKTSPVIDQKKAKVLAKVARKTTASKQSPPKQNVKPIKPATSTNKKGAVKKPAVTTPVTSSNAPIRKSKRGKK